MLFGSIRFNPPLLPTSSAHNIGDEDTETPKHKNRDKLDKKHG